MQISYWKTLTDIQQLITYSHILKGGDSYPDLSGLQCPYPTSCLTINNDAYQQLRLIRLLQCPAHSRRRELW